MLFPYYKVGIGYNIAVDKQMYEQPIILTSACLACHYLQMLPHEIVVV